MFVDELLSFFGFSFSSSSNSFRKLVNSSTSSVQSTFNTSSASFNSFLLGLVLAETSPFEPINDKYRGTS